MPYQRQVSDALQYRAACHWKRAGADATRKRAAHRNQSITPIVPNSPGTELRLASGDNMDSWRSKSLGPWSDLSVSELANRNAPETRKHCPWRGEAIHRHQGFDHFSGALQRRPFVRGTEEDHVGQLRCPAMTTLVRRRQGAPYDEPAQTVRDDV